MYGSTLAILKGGSRKIPGKRAGLAQSGSALERTNPAPKPVLLSGIPDGDTTGIEDGKDEGESQVDWRKTSSLMTVSASFA